jgi:hypothetical protein
MNFFNKSARRKHHVGGFYSTKQFGGPIHQSNPNKQPGKAFGKKLKFPNESILSIVEHLKTILYITHCKQPIHKINDDVGDAVYNYSGDCAFIYDLTKNRTLKFGCTKTLILATYDEDNNIKAMCIAEYCRKDIIFLHSLLAVNQRQGHGSEILSAIKELAIHNNWIKVYLDCDSYLIPFYVRNGFTSVHGSMEIIF